MRDTSEERRQPATPAAGPTRIHAARSLAAAIVLVLPGCSSDGNPAVPTPEAKIAGTVHICSSCHGIDGKSVGPTFPRLAGQQSLYLETQLKAFRDHSRADPHAHTYMWGMAAHLTDETIQGLAAYYSSLSPAAGSPGDPTELAAGEKIFNEGIPAKDVPPCKACHGDKAEGQVAFPRLAGQHYDYLVRQLDAFASNARANEIMHENSVRLDSGEIVAIATYLAAQ
jgi:cytochrome c553